MDYPAQRRERLLQLIRSNDLHGFLVTNPVNVTYLTGFSGDSSYLLAGRDRVLLVSDGRYTEQLREECPDLPVHIRPPSIRLADAAAEVLDKIGWKRIGFESSHLTVGEFAKYRERMPVIDWSPCADAVETLRMCKDEGEIAQIRAAIGMAERAFERFRRQLRPEDTEKRLGDRMESLLREEGARCGSFPAIIAVGARAALPHAPLTSTPLRGAELLLVDWGACGRLYKSDLTRVLTPSTISPKLEQVYEVVRRAQQRALQKLRPGVQAQEVDAEARAAMDEASFGPFFSHGLGHGIGLDIHENPFLRPHNTTRLEPGMVLTIEPGIYLPGWGGVRLEDDVLITPDGHEILSSIPKDLHQAVGWSE
jgi:Xaa-Pro aminopeptidase